MFEPLKIKEYRKYWFAQTISLTGTWMQQIAQNWLVYVLTKSAFYLGFISFLSSLPMLLLTLFGGVIADRYSRKKIILITQILSLIPAVFLGILIHLEKVTIWHVAVASIVLGVAASFDMPARHAFITEIVPSNLITSAIAMQSMSFNLARMIGPILAGVIVTHLNFQTCFYLNALSFIPLIIVLISLCTKSCVNPDSHSSIGSLFKEGALFLYENKSILYLIYAIGAYTIFGISFIPLLPIIADQILKSNAEGLGMIVSSIGAGSLLAATAIALKKDIHEKEVHIFKSSMVFPIGLLGIALSQNIYITMFFAFVLGGAFVNFFAVSNSYIQSKTDHRLRGRVMSFFSFVFLGFTPIGNILAGVLVDNFGIKNVLLLYSSLCLISGILFLKILPNKKRS